MKKYTFIFALGVVLTLTACGSGSATNEATDSTAAQVDTSAVTTADTLSAGGGSAEAGEKPTEAVK